MGRPPKYPWDEWFSGEDRTLRRGEDFDEHTDVDNLRNYILARARVEQTDVITSVVDDDTVTLMFPVRRALPTELLSQNQWYRLIADPDPLPRTMPSTIVGKTPFSIWAEAIERQAGPRRAYRLTYDRFANTITFEPLRGGEYDDFDAEER